MSEELNKTINSRLSEDTKSLIKSIFAAFSKEPVVKVVTEPIGTKEAVKLTEAKLKDGSGVIKYEGETPTEGMSITWITENGDTPVPDGNYELEDGTVISCVESKITKVVAPKAPEAEMSDEKLSAVKKEIEEKFTALTAENKLLAKQNADNRLLLEQMFKVVNAIAEVKLDKIEAEKFSTEETQFEKRIKIIDALIN